MNIWFEVEFTPKAGGGLFPVNTSSVGAVSLPPSNTSNCSLSLPEEEKTPNVRETW